MAWWVIGRRLEGRKRGVNRGFLTLTAEWTGRKEGGGERPLFSATPSFPSPPQPNLPRQQKGVCELLSQTMSLLGSEPSLASTSLEKKPVSCP